MKLTLSSGGGFTGLTKGSSIDIDSLDKDTRAALMEYINSAHPKSPGNFNETWMLGEEGQEVPVHPERMNDHLLKLYSDMRSQLTYRKP